MKCNNCGYENNDNAKFCNECGAILNEVKDEQIHENKIEVINEEAQPIKQEEKEKNINCKAKVFDLLKKRRTLIILVIPFVFVAIVIGVIIYNSVNAPKPKDVFNQFNKSKNLAIQKYNQLSYENKQKVQTLIKEKLNSLYDAGDDKKLDYEILSYTDITELKDYISKIEDQVQCRKIYNEAQEMIDKANGIDNMKDYEWMTLLDKYCSIPETYENYNDVLDKIILLRDKYYNRFFNIPQSMKNRNIRIGMSEKEVLASKWGRPKDINKTTNAYGTNEQWIYNGYKYLYFDDDKLTSIQE